MATIVGYVREGVVVTGRALAEGVASKPNVRSSGTLATRVEAGEAFDATKTTIIQTKSGTTAETIAEAIGSDSTSRQLMSNAVQQGVEDALLDRVGI